GFEISGSYAGVEIAGGADGIAVRNCYIHDITQSHPGTYSESRGIDITSGGSEGCIAANNVIQAGWSVGVMGATNTTVINNTMVDSIAGLAHSASIGTILRNNIITGMSTAAIWVEGSATGIAQSNNLFYDTPAYCNDTNLMPDPSCINDDPAFVGGMPFDYHLQSYSPAVDAGVDVGLAFKGTAPDIGAFESSYSALSHTYHVRPDGSDLGTGLSYEEAWKSIARGDQLGILKPGDTVLVHPGTYTPDPTTGTVAAFWNCSGTADNPITYKADGSGVILQGAGGSVKDYGFVIYQSNKLHDITIDGFEIRGFYIGVYELTGPNIIVKRCVIGETLPSGECVQVWGVDLAPLGGVLVNARIENCVFKNMPGAGGIPVRVEGGTDGTKAYNNTFDNTGWSVMSVNWGGDAHPDNVNMEVKNNLFHDTTESSLLVNGPIPVHEYNLYDNAVIGASSGTGEIVGYAGFVGGSPYDYRPGYCSDAIDAGTYLGTAFMGEAPDIGAFEVDPVALAPRAYIEGVVINDVTNTPIPGAQIRSLTSGETTTSASDGTFRLCLKAGSQTIACSLGQVSVQWQVTLGQDSTTIHDFVLHVVPQGKTYYVKNGGNDSADGLSLAMAWASIDNGDKKGILKAADVVQVQAGSYTNVRINQCSGMAGYPITYKANGNVKLICDGSNYVMTVDGTANYVTFDGFEVSGTIGSAGYGIVITGSDYVTITNFYIHPVGSASDQIKIDGGCVGCSFENNITQGIGSAGDWMWLIYNATNTRIVNNVFDNGYIAVLHWNNSTGTVFTNNIITNMTYAALLQWQPATSWTQSYNCFYNNADDSTRVLGTGEIKANPSFMGGIPSDYHLQTGSPCIDAGINVGLYYDGVAPDMGAFESPTAIECTSISALKNAPVGATVRVRSPKIVTAGTGTFSDGSIYVEEADRSGGVRLIPAAGTSFSAVLPGSAISFRGIVRQGSEGEVYIELYSMSIGSAL
ncbi:MAG TPA: right-handed parallel beta-helix repeat-containing protein, partial [Armatimonadota bacterium]|nr:right-handed parallel beta-helix repeat-containing protein [Armatimonadota bacterium]